MFNRLGLCLLFLTPFAANVYAADDVSMMNLKQRLERLERLTSSEVLIQQSQQLDSIREEISALRQDIELQNYELETIKQRQRSLYLDMDRRLQGLEVGNNGSTGVSGNTIPVPPPTSGSPTNTDTHSNMIDTNANVDGKEDYSKAFGYLKEGRYSKSISEFEKFIKNYPDSKFSDNAQYWLGEANYVSRNYKRALSEFQKLIANFPDSSKISGARLKIGYTYFELKNWPAANKSLQQVIALYPNTTVAKKANDRLQRMKREGHK